MRPIRSIASPEERPMLGNITDTRLRLLIALGLIAITVAAYWPVFGNKFVNFDDDHYVYNNPRVQDGISLSNIAWAFTSTQSANWHPLTWISHMVDCQVFKLKPWGHHLTSLLLHLANTLLLFLLLHRMTGFVWRSAFVAALFAIHPLHVESVAWVAERKDVLSTFFFMLTLIAYVRYAECPSIRRYLLVAGTFILGLMAKPMLVSLPIVLLLLDFWPLRRFAKDGKSGKKQTARSQTVKVLTEKIPLFALSLGSCIVTMVAQRAGGAFNSLEGLPLGERLATAVSGYTAYILKMLWPVKLGVIYPHPFGSLPAWQVVGSAVLLALISALVYRTRQSRPYLAFGWLWFVITLIPVIGLVQVGSQFIADRYTYIPLVGLFVSLTWGLSELPESRTQLRSPALALVSVVIILLGAGTFRQVGYWKNGCTLFSHTLKVAKPSATAHTNLGIALAARGRFDEAIGHYKQALELNPGHANALFNMGNAYVRKKMYDEAVEHYLQAVEIYEEVAQGGSVEAHTNLGNAYFEMRMYEQAAAEFEKALAIKPDYLPAMTNLGNMLKETGRFEEAEEVYRAALRIRPKDPESHSSLGVALAGQGMLDEAMEEFQRALELNPRHANAHVNLANVYAARKELDKAEKEYRLAISIKHNIAEAHHNLGLVLKSQGDLAGAIKEFRKAVDINPSIPTPHVSLATALYQVGDYEGAWREIHACRDLRARPPQQLIDMLSDKMPDPGR